MATLEALEPFQQPREALERSASGAAIVDVEAAGEQRAAPRKRGAAAMPWISGSNVRGAWPDAQSAIWARGEAQTRAKEQQRRSNGGGGDASERRKKSVREKEPEALPLVGL